MMMMMMMMMTTTLPSHLKHRNISQEQFKSGLKTSLFVQAGLQEVPLRTLFKRFLINVRFDWSIDWAICVLADQWTAVCRPGLLFCIPLNLLFYLLNYTHIGADVKKLQQLTKWNFFETQCIIVIFFLNNIIVHAYIFCFIILAAASKKACRLKY